MDKNIEVSVIIPAYNEEKIIASSIQKISSFFKDREHEIIVVDDGSTDNTFKRVSELPFPNLKILRNYKNFGKGYAVKRGILHSSGKFVFFTDADLSTPIEDYEKLEIALRNGNDIVLGSRLLKDSRIIESQPLIRIILGKLYGIFAHALVWWSIKDTQCGFKLFKGDVAREIFGDLEIYGYSFDIEVILIAKKRGYRMIEVPVRWKNYRESKIRVFSTIYFSVFYELFKIFVKKLRDIY